MATLKSRLFGITFTITLVAASHSAFAQPPDAGRQIQQIPPLPTLQKAVPELPVPQKKGQPEQAPAGPRILVKSLRVTGQTLFAESELIAAAGFKPDSQLNLADLRQMASRISAYYNERGYFVAQAYLPAQDIKDGVVTIAVIEGRYGKVGLNNKTNLSDNLANGVLSGLHPGDVITTAPLERRLLLLSDIPGVEVQSTMTPGASVGTSDLIVDVVPGQRVTGSVEADNAGNRYTGENRLGGSVSLNNPLGIGDVATLRVLTSDAGLHYGRLSYQAQVYSATVGVAYAKMWYRLGREFSSLDANGTAEIASVYGSYPLIRSRNDNLYAVADFDEKSFEDKVDVTSTVTNRKIHVLMAGLSGDHHDNFGGGGWSAYSLTWTVGDLDIQSPLARAIDAATARTNGQYHKLSFTASRLQRVTDRVSLYGAVRGQYAFKNLDTSEQMELGGAYAVRAYPEGEAYGDHGYVMNLEARLLLPKLTQRLPGQVQLFTFVDNGSVTLAKDPWVSGENHRTLSAVGVGVTWADYNDFAIRATYAHKLGGAVATSAPDSSSGRFWIQASKLF